MTDTAYSGKSVTAYNVPRGTEIFASPHMGKCLSLNGTNQYAYIADNDILNVGEEDFGYSVWFKTSSTASQRFVSKNWGSNGSYILYINNGTINQPYSTDSLRKKT